MCWNYCEKLMIPRSAKRGFRLHSSKRHKGGDASPEEEDYIAVFWEVSLEHPSQCERKQGELMEPRLRENTGEIHRGQCRNFRLISSLAKLSGWNFPDWIAKRGLGKAQQMADYPVQGEGLSFTHRLDVDDVWTTVSQSSSHKKKIWITLGIIPGQQRNNSWATLLPLKDALSKDVVICKTS